MKCSFIHGEIPGNLWKKMMQLHIRVFTTQCFKLLRPVRNTGYQLHLLVAQGGSTGWKKENVEIFLNKKDGIVGSDGKRKENPISIYVE